MKKIRSAQATTPAELGRLLKLSEEDAVEIELRVTLNNKIIDVVKKRRLTHAAVAKLAETSRTKITALLNRNTTHISTSMMIRVLAALGVRVKISFAAIKAAA
jgi:predicted XRE-type DNA-binding protein